jgi:hypothetical protein
LPVSRIVDYTFHKCNEYFVNRWDKALHSMAKGERWGEPTRKHLLEQCEICTNEVVVLFDMAKGTRSSHQVERMSVLRYQEVAYSEWRLAMW